VWEDGSFSREAYRRFHRFEEVRLNLRPTPVYLRDELSEKWSRETSQENVDYAPVRFVRFEEWKDMNAPGWWDSDKLVDV
jgi:hypothetical protein